RSPCGGSASADVPAGLSWTMDGAHNHSGIPTRADALARGAPTPALRERLCQAGTCDDKGVPVQLPAPTAFERKAEDK
ncbi:hypothetical protein, partial [Escherichia coli]|uniref:hypothetical protein n=1 Tax=Escherichia coli TaxID=562 RepID=UPI003F1F0749